MASNSHTVFYAKLVQCGLLEHIGRDSKPAKLPADIGSGKAKLTSAQETRLNDTVKDLIQHIKGAKLGELDLPGYKGEEQINEFASSIVTYGVANNIDGARDAQQKLNSSTDEEGDSPMKNDPSSEAEQARERAEQDMHKDAANLQASTAALDNQNIAKNSNAYITTGSAAIRCSEENSSILARWAEKNAYVEINGDRLRTVILFEYKRKSTGGNSQNGFSSLFGVQRVYDGKYCYELVRRSEITSEAANIWENIVPNEDKLILTPSEENAVPFRKEDVGDIKWFYFVCYKVPSCRTAGKSKTSPATICAVETSKKPGIQLLTYGKVKIIAGLDRAKEYVEITCRRDGIPTPWETKSQQVVANDEDCHRPRKEANTSNNTVQMPQMSNVAMSSEVTPDYVRKVVEDRFSPLEKRLGELESSVTARLGQFEDNIMMAIQKMFQKLSHDGNSRNTGSLNTQEKGNFPSSFPSPPPED